MQISLHSHLYANVVYRNKVPLPLAAPHVSHLQLSYYTLLFKPYLRPASPGVARRLASPGVARRCLAIGVARRSASLGVVRRLSSPGVARRCSARPALLGAHGVAWRARRCSARPALLGAPGVAWRARRCSARPALLGAPGVARRARRRSACPALLGVPGVARRCPALGNAGRCPAPLGGSDFTTRLPPRSEYGVYGDFLMIYPKPYSIYLRHTIHPRTLNPKS